MTLSPSLSAVQSLLRELATPPQPPETIAARLLDSLKASFGPGRVALGLINAESGVLEITHREGIEPGPALEALLAWAESTDAGSASPLPTGTPLLAGSRLLGAVALDCGERQPDPALLDALAAITALALESGNQLRRLEITRLSWVATADAVPVALCVIDEHSRVRRANRAFGELLGAELPVLLERPWPALVPPGWVEGIGAALSTAGTRREAELRAGDRTFAVTGFPVRGTQPAMSLLVFEDQSDRRRLQAQLVQSEKMSAIGQLIAGVAHDLNNPLASVVGFADLLAESEDVPARLKEPLRVIRDEADRAAGIVHNLLGFARQQERQRRPVSVRKVLNATMGLLRNQLMTHGVESVVELDHDLPEVTADPNQIQQVFVNLISNAAQAIASGGRPGTVTVRGRRRDTGIAIEIIDDGPGMTAEVAARVFEPFFTTKPEGQGTGLGLSIGQGIVKEHGGRITVTTAPEAGATFTVELPGSSGPPADTPPEAEPTAVAGLRVLVIDDEPHILHYMRATLEAWGHDVEVAPDGSAGLELALARDFDIIITDLRMPRLGGREFSAELERRAPTLLSRLVFSTGDAIRGDTLVFLEEQGRPCLHKPFSLAELRSVLAEVSRSAATP
ncbi:MAG TPA: ATP-binding protein [Gemmatimonadales bacterium]|nr:ATP-binding protein [Gemmatimonadales bacterium]